MKLKTLTIEGYKGFEKKITIDFAEKTTAIVGVNGSGKTSILEAIKAILGFVYMANGSEVIGSEVISSGKFDFRFVNDKLIAKPDLSLINNNSSKALGELTFILDDEQFNSKFKMNKEQSLFNIFENKQVMERIEDYFDQNLISMFSIPIMLFYSTGRGIGDIDLDKIGQFVNRYKREFENNFSGITNFDAFFEWFKEREDYENEVRLSDDPAFRLKDLNAVRKAITGFLDDFDDLRVKRHPKVDMVIKKGKTELSINQLSHGERIVLAMIGDIARRLSLANPKLEDVLEGQGVILIDEIELHLHPKWQRKIIQKLESIFPNCQFVITTHSPQVLSELDHKVDKTILLDNYEVFDLPISYGRDSNWILDVLMQVPSRPIEIQEKLDKYFELIDLEKIEEAKSLRIELEDLIGSDEPEFIKADILMRRKLKATK